MLADGAAPSAAVTPAPWAAPEQIALALESTAISVRDGLDRIVRHPKLAGLGEEAIGTLWTVLAEVLNNVVEHAYADYPGAIGVRLWRDGTSVAVEVTDRGLPMPGLKLPEGCLPLSEQPPECFGDLPEGSYGWYLIRALTDRLAYHRTADGNRLRFSMICP